MTQWAPISKLDARILLHCHLGCRHTLVTAHCGNVAHARFDMLQVALKFLAREHFIVHRSRKLFSETCDARALPLVGGGSESVWKGGSRGGVAWG